MATDRDPLDAIADVACPHVHHHAMCAPCAADAIRPEVERLHSRVERLRSRNAELQDLELDIKSLTTSSGSVDMSLHMAHDMMRILVSGFVTTARCPSCDHLTIGHQQDGCWYAVTLGTVGRDLVCPCTVPAASLDRPTDTTVCPHGKPTSADQPAITTTGVTLCACCGDSFNGRVSGSDRCKTCRANHPADTTGETR